jgi:hypothetical protein
LDPYAVLRDAVVNKRQVVAEYEGRRRDFCPHVLGLKNGRRRCLAYQFAGETSSGAAKPGPDAWRCFDVDRLLIIEVREGPWFSGPVHSRRQTCVDVVDVDSERPRFAVIAGFRRGP